jgi:hypothetical protein
MSKPVIARAADPIRAANWGLMLLGIVFLGIGLWSATGAFVDLDFINVHHLNSWPHQVNIEMSIAIILMGLGPWCVLRGIRSPVPQR